ncbi:MAG: DUF294 nucleotidyltransferase-like domain-containing protein [Beijerinckiaceae bacterium]
MSKDPNETPLFALNAVAVDTETTGLDPDKARVMEIGCCRIPDEAGAAFQSFVAIDGDVPPEAARVTGIDAAMLRGAPDFPEAFRSMLEFAGERVVVGHSFGFDIAVFAAECARNGMERWAPVALDTRFLGQIAIPNLPDYTLEMLASRLGVPVEDRHRAHGDAIVTARVFQALTPLLRERNIRTLGEAIAACKRFEERADYPKVWAPLAPAETLREDDRHVAPLDTFLFTQHVASVMTLLPKFVAPQATVAEATALMAQEKAGSLLVGSAGETGDNLGILTERDVLRAIGSGGADGLAKTAGAVASRPLQCIHYEAFMYRAIGRMNRLNIRHLGVTDASGRVIGVVSARDLLRSRLSAPVALADGIDTSDDEMELGRVWAQLPSAARAMLANNMDGREVSAVVGREVAALTRRTAILAERRMQAEGAGPAPCRYAVVVLGSAGRSESLLAFDQDNAIVYETGEPEGPEDQWFAKLGAYMCDTLHAVGVPYCEGGVMAKNAAWRGSVSAWERRAATWIGKSRPEDLLAVDITFDFRPVHGDLTLAEDLWRRMWAMAQGQFAFLKLLAEAGAAGGSAFGFFGNLQTQNGRIDLKRLGLKSVVTAARILALRHQVLKRSTVERLRGVIAIGKGPERDLERMIEAQRIFLTCIARQQVRDMAEGRKPNNTVVFASLGAREQGELRDALKHMEYAGQIVRDALSA